MARIGEKGKGKKKTYQYIRCYRNTWLKWKSIAAHYQIPMIKILDEVAQMILKAKGITYQEEPITIKINDKIN